MGKWGAARRYGSLRTLSEPERDPRARMRTKLLVDVGLFVAFAFVSAPQFTGLLWHEWLSLAFIPVFLVHVLLSWSLIVRVVKRFTKRLGGESRFNTIFDLFSFGLMHWRASVFPNVRLSTTPSWQA